MNETKRITCIIIGPVLFAASALLLTDTLTLAGAEAIGTLLWMLFWWLTRPVNITVTAFLPIVVNAIFGIVDMSTVVAQYFCESIVLIFGSCLLIANWKITGFDRRVALKILTVLGPSMTSQIVVWMLASIVFSTVLPNVVVVSLFTPIAVAMLKAAGYDDIKTCKQAIPILLAIGWGAGIGGVGTPFGGAMNVAAITFLEELTGEEVMYGSYVLHILPYLLVATAALLAVMLIMHRNEESLEGTKDYFATEYAKLGPTRRDEKIAGVLFVVALILGFARPLFSDLLPELAPAYIFVGIGGLAFFITREDKTGPLLTWELAQENVMWGMMMLFGGGLALGKIVNLSGAAESIANIVTSMSLDGGLTTVIVFAVLAILISEATSSTVSSAVVVPIVLAFTTQLGLNPIPYWFLAVMAFNSEFLLPVSVRAIPASYGLDPNAMMKRGIPMLVTRLVVVVVMYLVCSTFWPGFAVM